MAHLEALFDRYFYME